MMKMAIAEHARLSWFDRNRIERAIDQALTAEFPVRTTVEQNGVTYTVTIVRSLTKYQKAARRAQADH